MPKKTDLTLTRVVNYAIITAEYQTAVNVSDVLRKTLPNFLIGLMEDRLDFLEEASRNELMDLFDVETKVGQLIATPVYTEEEGERLYNLYLQSLTDKKYDDKGCKIRDLALYRKASPILYTRNAPVFRVWEFLEHPEYKALLDNDAYSEDELAVIHETLFYVFNVESKDFKTFLANSSCLHKETMETLALIDTVC